MSGKIKYTTEDIRRYLEGKLSPAQMHALEKAALSDPFLADALKGMEVHGDSIKFNADVEELRSRLTGRAKNKKGALASVGSLWWKIAAVLVIIITGVAVIILSGEKNKTAQNEFAKTEEHLNKNVRNKNANKEQEKKTEEVSSAEDKAGEKKDIPSTGSSKQSEPVKKLKKPATAQSDAEKIEKSEEAKEPEQIVASKIPSVNAAPETDSVLPSEKMPQPTAQHQANVAQELEGRAAGVNVSRAETNDSIFDEVIVVGYGNTKKKSSKSRTLSAGRAERRVTPGNGWDEFEQYIEDSTRINTADSVFTGEEHVSFLVGDDGLPESIKILRSISPSHDQEAIRLLQNGPAWKIAKGRKREIRLKIIF
jgi:hypothetical protein